MKILSLVLLIMQFSYAQESKEFNQVLTKYEKLHQAFFDNDLAKTKTQAKEVSSAISKINDPEVLKLLTYTQKKLTELQNSENLDKSKEAMNVVSQGILNVLEKHAPNKNYARYYCPMKKKYWIQNIKDSEKVMNPYASASMPHCGTKK